MVVGFTLRENKSTDRFIVNIYKSSVPIVTLLLTATTYVRFKTSEWGNTFAKLNDYLEDESSQLLFAFKLAAKITEHLWNMPGGDDCVWAIRGENVYDCWICNLIYFNW